MTYLVGRFFNWAITATATSDFLLVGYDQGVMSGLLTGDAFMETFAEIHTTNGSIGSPVVATTKSAVSSVPSSASSPANAGSSHSLKSGNAELQQRELRLELGAEVEDGTNGEDGDLEDGSPETRDVGAEPGAAV